MRPVIALAESFWIRNTSAMADLTASEAARRLGSSQRWVTALARRHALEAPQISDGTWLIESRSVNAFLRTARGRGRPWSADSSWALLAELQGTPLHRIAPYVRSRVHQRIRALDIETIVRGVSGRVEWVSYATDDVVAVAEMLAVTGSSAAATITNALTAVAGGVQGYLVSTGSLSDRLAGRAILLPDPSGAVRIASAPIAWSFGSTAPEAVVAADLAVAADARERAVGRQVLQDLRERWLVTNGG